MGKIHENKKNGWSECVVGNNSRNNDILARDMAIYG